MNTLIEKITHESDIVKNDEPFIFDTDKLSKYVLDLSLQQEIRVKALEMYYNIHGDSTIELISRITGMYQFSGTKIIQNFLSYICFNNVQISTFLKLECAKSLLSFFEFEDPIREEDDETLREVKEEDNACIKERNESRKSIGYKALKNVCHDISKDSEFPTPCKIDAVCMLMETDDYKLDTCTYFKDIIDDVNLNCDFRYKTILSLEKRGGVSSSDCKLLNIKFYITESCLKFLSNIKNKIMYRILSCQYLLQNCELDEETKIKAYNILYEFSTDNDLDYNLRADAADTLLTFGTDDFKIKARDIITLLGKMYGTVRNMYDNAQNVHTKEIEKSVGEILEFLLTYKTNSVGENNIDYDHIVNKIEEILKKEVETIEI
jgi:hypothetical protein